MPFRWSTTSTPIGDLLLVATQDGLARVAFECEDFDAVLRALQDGSGEHAAQHDAPEAEAQLAEYFAGERRQFDIALDWRLATGFRGRCSVRCAALTTGARSLTQSSRADWGIRRRCGRGQRVRHQPPADCRSLSPRAA